MMTKICPSCGYREPDMQSLYCNKCGYPFPQQQPQRQAAAPAPAGRPAPHAAKRPVKRKTGGSGFLSFGTLITENHLKLIYILGAVMIVLVSIMGIAGMFAKKTTGEKASTNESLINTSAIAEYPAGSPLFWVVFLIIGSVLWRMFCELFVILFRGHGTPPEGNEQEPEYGYETADYGVDEPAVQQSRAGSGQMVECPKCHKVVPIEDLRECQHCGIQGCVNCIRMMGLLKKTLTCRECYEAK
ncbi:MAG: DUF4282 domain-containing protein [Methanoregula sp.]|jgi:hypothetical protein